MTTIVITSEEDPCLTVVRFTSELSWADAGPEVLESEVAKLLMETQESIVMGQWLDLTSLMLTSSDVMFSKVSEKDLECIFTIICNLVTKSESPDEALEIVKLITAKITQQATEKPALRLKILFSLYNLLDNPYSKFYVYMQILKLAVEGKVTESVIPSFKKTDSFVKEWDISILDERELYLSIFNILKESKSMVKDSFNFLTKYLVTFSGEDAYVMGEAKEEAVRAIVEFVKSPDVFQCDLLDLPSIGQLEKDENHKLMYQLLRIFLALRLDAYIDFHAANSDLLRTHGIVHEDCMLKMRLMSLADLGSENSVIPYAVIRDTLQITDDEVELWVLKAITAKLLDCKMDQMNQTLIVSHCTKRMFGLQHWETLQTKLAAWKGNLSNVISTIQANKVTDDNSRAVKV